MPDLLPAHNEWVAFWNPDDVEPYAVWWGTMGQAFVACHGCLPDDVVTAAFALCEEGLLSNDRETRNLIATGFLESLVNRVDEGELDQEWLRTHAGPEAIAYIRAWDEVTRGFTDY